MTDRELLELAAKAAGINVFDWTPGGHPTIDGSYDGIWNPLTNDGDALRLRNALQMTIIDEGDNVFVEVNRYPTSSVVRESYKRDLPSGFASQASVDGAVRRAIVRAAAYIGKDMLERDDRHRNGSR